MRHLRRIGIGVAVAVGGWIIALVLLGTLGADAARTRLEADVARALGAEVRVDALDLALVRGVVEVRGVRLHKATSGELDVEVVAARADVAPLGAVLASQRLRTLTARGVTVRATSREVLTGQVLGDRPLVADAITIDDARVELGAGTLLPGIALTIDARRVRAGPTRLVTPLSWVLALRELDARLDVVGGPIDVTLRGTTLTAVGGLLGDEPIEVALDGRLSTDDLPDEPVARRAAELERITALAGYVTEQLAWIRATRLLGVAP